jgi:hypothetical protein
MILQIKLLCSIGIYSTLKKIPSLIKGKGFEKININLLIHSSTNFCVHIIKFYQNALSILL